MPRPKFAIVIPDGCADDPVAALGGRTPLEAARLPNMDRVAALGVVGMANNVPPSLTPASDVATLSLCGYDPLEVYTGRAPLEAAAMGIPLGPNDWAIRCNFVSSNPDGTLESFTAGHISSADAAELIATLQAELGGEGLEFHAGVSYRNLLVARGTAAPLGGTQTQPPHDIPGRPLSDHLPRGPGRDFLAALMDASRAVLAGHPVNQRRLERGEPAATQIWLWGLGQAPRIRPFAQVYGPSGAIISGVDLVRGVAQLLGWSRIDVPGATGYLDTDYAAKGRHAVAALDRFDLVCVHVEAPDEASHEGRADAKVTALERIDADIVGPLLEALAGHAGSRILVEPDHRTTLETKTHARGAVPFALAQLGHAAGFALPPGGATRYDEATAAASGLAFDPGWHLMRFALGAGGTRSSEASRER